MYCAAGFDCHTLVNCVTGMNCHAPLNCILGEGIRRGSRPGPVGCCMDQDGSTGGGCHRSGIRVTGSACITGLGCYVLVNCPLGEFRTTGTNCHALFNCDTGLYCTLAANCSALSSNGMSRFFEDPICSFARWGSARGWSSSSGRYMHTDPPEDWARSLHWTKAPGTLWRGGPTGRCRDRGYRMHSLKPSACRTQPHCQGVPQLYMERGMARSPCTCSGARRTGEDNRGDIKDAPSAERRSSTASRAQD